MAVIFDGKARARMEEDIIRIRVRELKSQYGVSPHLVTILVGDDKASKIYTRLKKEAAQRVGIAFTIRIFEIDAGYKDIQNYIKEKNKDHGLHGIMVQMPLPKNLDTKSIIKNIAKEKDVDGLRAKSPFVHPTVKAICEVVEIAATTGNEKIAVVGAKGMVGGKTARFLAEKGYRVTEVDVKTKEKVKILNQADIIITATGKEGIISKNMVKKGACVIDVGSPKPEAQSDVYQKAKLITPVPGGIGPMTIAELLKNVILASEKTIDISKE